jgi:PBP1b-binding outer membrane lipoprotein LpoB
MRVLFGLMMCAIFLSGCTSEPDVKQPEAKVDNTVTRYTEGLVTATEKAKDSVAKANEAMAASQAIRDQMVQEIQ